MNKQGFEFSFGWLFSLLVGAAILFLAVYGVTSLVRTERMVQDTLSARQLEIILQPLETQSFEAGIRPQNISFPSDTRLLFTCNKEGVFGTETIAVASRSGIGKAWQDAGVGSTLADKYLFAEPQVEGRTFYLFTKPLHLPFKVTDLIFIWTKPYCFVQAPQQVEDDFAALGINGSSIEMATSLSACTRGSTRVCFGGGGSAFADGCDISVDVTAQRVQKEGRAVYYEGPLLYGALFSTPEVYDCVLARVMKRAASLARLYDDTSKLIARSSNGCSSALQPVLASYISAVNTSDSKAVYRSLHELTLEAEQLRLAQQPLTCPLWKEDAS